MKIPFKSATGAPNQLKDTDFSEFYASVNGALKWSAIKPYIEQSVILYVLPFLGKEMYDKLVDDYISGEDDPVKVDLIKKLQTTVAYYSIYHAMPKLNTVIAERGIQEQGDSKGNSRPSGMWRFKNTRWDVMLNADQFLDVFMAMLEQEVVAENIYVSLWKNSAAYKTGRTAFFKSSDELSEFIRIKGSRKAFLQLIPYVKRAERDIKRNLLCEDLFETLKLRGDLSEKEKELLVFVQETVAMKALYAAIPDLRVLIDGDGIQFVMTTDGMNVRKEAYDSAVADLSHNSMLKSRRSMADLIEFLYENADAFPDWKNSACYNEDDTDDYRASVGAIDI